MARLPLMAHLVLIAKGTGMRFSKVVNVRLSLDEQGERSWPSAWRWQGFGR